MNLTTHEDTPRSEPSIGAADRTPPVEVPGLTFVADGPAASTRPAAGPVGGRYTMAWLQNLVVSLVVDVLVFLVLVVLLWVVVGVARDVWTAVTTTSIDAFKNLSIELLTVFVFIELFHSLSEYMRFRRIRVTHLVDASLAFVLREVWVGMYGGDMDWRKTLALSSMVIALGAVRTAAVVFSPSERAADIAEG